MKILFDHHLPFALAHGGFQQTRVQTKSALEQGQVETFRRRASQRRGNDRVAEAPQFHDARSGF